MSESLNRFKTNSLAFASKYEPANDKVQIDSFVEPSSGTPSKRNSLVSVNSGSILLPNLRQDVLISHITDSDEEESLQRSQNLERLSKEVITASRRFSMTKFQKKVRAALQEENMRNKAMGSKDFKSIDEETKDSMKHLNIRPTFRTEASINKMSFMCQPESDAASEISEESSVDLNDSKIPQFTQAERQVPLKFAELNMEHTIIARMTKPFWRPLAAIVK